MKTVIIHGQNHKGSTYHIARMLADKVGGEVTEFFLPRDFSDFCIGCAQCFEKAAEKCPHYEVQQKILHVMDEADLIILASPVYVYHVSAPMKNFLDHQGDVQKAGGMRIHSSRCRNEKHEQGHGRQPVFLGCGKDI